MDENTTTIDNEVMAKMEAAINDESFAADEKPEFCYPACFGYYRENLECEECTPDMDRIEEECKMHTRGLEQIREKDLNELANKIKVSIQQHVECLIDQTIRDLSNREEI